jgi:hypothetical protein
LAVWVSSLGVMLTNQRSNPNDRESPLESQGQTTQGANRFGVHAPVLADSVGAGGLVLLDHHQITTMSQGVSIKDLTAEWQRKPTIQQLAMSEPAPSDIAQRVWDAHEEAKRKMRQHGSATAEITFRPDVGAFELVAENKDVASILRALGPQAKITIHF